MGRVNLLRPYNGSRRRIARIRWKRAEIIHAIILFLVMAAFCICMGIWIATHRFD